MKDIIGMYSKIFLYSKRIKEELKIDEDTFNNTKFEESDNPLDFWLYSIVDDVYKAGIKAIKEQEIIGGEEIKDDKFKKEDSSLGLNFKRYIYENISIEIDVWMRKMTEHLLNLILLKRVEEHELENISKIYFFSLRLKDVLTKINNYKEYYSFEYESGFIEKDLLVKKLENELKGKEKPFFLKANIEKLKDIKNPSQLIESTADLYKKSIEKCKNNEKLVLGRTYLNYHNITQGIHGNGHYRNKDITLDFCIKRYSHLGLLLISIISIVYDLKNIQKDDYLSNSSKLEENLESNFKQKYTIGDLVIFKGDLYIIKETIISKYGYISYLVYRELGSWKNEKPVPQDLIQLGITINNFDNIIDQIKGRFKKDDFLSFKEMKKEEQFNAIKSVILDSNRKGINIFKKT